MATVQFDLVFQFCVRAARSGRRAATRSCFQCVGRILFGRTATQKASSFGTDHFVKCTSVMRRPFVRRGSRNTLARKERLIAPHSANKLPAIGFQLQNCHRDPPGRRPSCQQKSRGREQRNYDSLVLDTAH